MQEGLRLGEGADMLVGLLACGVTLYLELESWNFFAVRYKRGFLPRF